MEIEGTAFDSIIKNIQEGKNEEAIAAIKMIKEATIEYVKTVDKFVQELGKQNKEDVCRSK